MAKNIFSIDSINLKENSPFVCESTTFPRNVSIDNKTIKDLLKSLTSWAVKTCLSHNAFTELLNILRNSLDTNNIPKDSRTLLKFDNRLKKDILSVSPGQYYHFGLKEGVLIFLKNHSVDNDETYKVLKVALNIDGLPLTKSSCSQFWPILALIENCSFCKPFPIAVYQGNSKPNDANNFLEALVNEIKGLSSNRLSYNKVNFTIKISKLLCDAPAKAFVLNVKNHNSYSGCTKCKVEGDYINHRIAYQSLESGLRTHDEFINMVDETYQKGHTYCIILSDININLVDHHHLVCLGVVKRLLGFWLSGRQGIRLFKEDVDKINTNLENCRKYCVREFARLPRSLK